MKYSFQQQELIQKYHKQGYSGRQIAKMLGLGKSGVNAFIARTNSPRRAGPRICFFDLETSAALVYCFGRHKQFINQDAVHREGGKILVAGYKFLGEDKTTVLYDKSQIRNYEDYSVCKMLWDIFSKADIVVAHNAKNFDIKMLELRCLANGLPPLPSVKVIDTLEIAKKKFRFPSNKLDSLAAYLGIGRKVSHEGIQLWVKVQNGDETALNTMVEYCAGDVDLLEAVYLVLRNRGLLGINLGLYFEDNKPRCMCCGSDSLKHTGRTVKTPTGVYNEIQCTECETVQRSRNNLLDKEKRSSLLATSK